MNRFLNVATLAFALTSPFAFAQVQAPPTDAATTQHGHAHNPHRAALRMGKELGLSPDQTARLEPILADRQQKVQALRSDASLTDAQRRQQMHTIQQSTRMQMSSVLTPDQMRQLKAMRRQRENKTAAPAGV